VVHDDEPVGLDGLQVDFDDERAVSDAGVMLVATLAARLGIEASAGRLVRLRRERPGAANAGRKVMALLFAMVLGADSIDDCEVLRAGRTRRLLGGWIPAPLTLGTFLRAFTFGHVRQLDALLGETLVRAWRAGAGPGEARLVIDVDSFVGEVCGRLKQGAAYGYTKLLGYNPILATRADTREVLHIRLRKGSANTQKGMLRFTEELIARVQRAGATGVKLLRADSGFWNTKVFKRLENAGWQYNGAWTVLGALAHNLLRWTQLIGLPDTTVRAARTLRRRPVTIAGGLTRHGRSWTLHLPARWPWQGDYIVALARIRALPAG
jgi:Transposase DDE domain group 1